MSFISTVLIWFVFPEQIITCRTFNCNTPAINSQTALFAFPLSGADFTRTLRRSPIIPEISSLEAFGTTFTIIFTPLQVRSIVFTLHHRMFFYFLSNDDNVVQTDALHPELLVQVLAPHYFDQV